MRLFKHPLVVLAFNFYIIRAHVKESDLKKKTPRPFDAFLLFSLLFFCLEPEPTANGKVNPRYVFVFF